MDDTAGSGALAPAARTTAGTPPSTESRTLAREYAAIEASLLDQGLLRQDAGLLDAPFTVAQLSDAFVQTALFKEYDETDEGIRARRVAAGLTRWERPVRYEARFSGSIDSAAALRDQHEIDHFAARLARLTGQRFSRAVDSSANFHVFILDEADRRAFGPELRRLIPGISNGTVAAIRDLEKSFYCVALSSDPQEDGTLDAAVIVVRAELPELMRRMCIHEEMAQAMGLPNDSRTARPSIFNDDSEFALLTRHDEILLRMLYDPRLRPGMRAETAADIVPVVAAELMAELG